MAKPKFTQEDIEFIYNELRKSTIRWSGRAECLNNVREKKLERYSKKDNKPIYKYYWKCQHCNHWFRNESDMEVDHVVEIGGVTSFNGDWNAMIDRIFARPVGKRLQALCKWCHLKKTNKYTAASKKYTRKK